MKTASHTVREMLRNHREPLGSLLAKRGISQIGREVKGLSEFCEDNDIDGIRFSEIIRQMRETDLFRPVLEMIRIQRVPLGVLEDMLADGCSIRDIGHEVKGLREFCNENGIDRKMLSEIVVWMSKKMGSDVLNVRRASAKLATSTRNKRKVEDSLEEDLSGLLKKANRGRYDDDDDDDVLNDGRPSAKLLATPTRNKRKVEDCLEAKNVYDLPTPRLTAKGRKNATQRIDEVDLPEDFKRCVESPGAIQQDARQALGAAQKLLERLRDNKVSSDSAALGSFLP